MPAELYQNVDLFLDALDEALDLRTIEHQAAKAGLSKYRLRSLIWERRERVWQAANQEVEEFVSARDTLRAAIDLSSTLTVEMPPESPPLKVNLTIRLAEAATALVAILYAGFAAIFKSLPRPSWTTILFVSAPIIVIFHILPGLYNLFVVNKGNAPRREFKEAIKKLDLPRLRQTDFLSKKTARHALLTKGIIPEINRLMDEPREPLQSELHHLKKDDASVSLPNYDIFLSYDERDRRVALKVYQRLLSRDLRPWLDYDQLLPGQTWQEVAPDLVNRSETVAVLVGKYEPWADSETSALLRRFLTKGLPVIIVLLPGGYGSPQGPAFLKVFEWVDLRAGLDDTALNAIVDAITRARTEKRAGGGGGAQESQSQSRHIRRPFPL